MSQLPSSRYKRALVAASFFAVTAAVVPVSADQKSAQNSAAALDGGLAVDVTVNGRPITRNHIALMGSNFTEDKKAPGPEAQAAARLELITQEVLAQAALKEGLDKQGIVADQIAFQERSILSRAYLEDYFAKNPVTDESLKAAYDANVASGKITEFKVRHILVSDLPQAQAIIARLAKGEDFVAIAKVETLDPGGQNNGGDLGWFRPDIFVDSNFANAVVALKKGGTSKDPVRSRFGWHVIKVEDGPRPVANPGKFDTLDDPIKQSLRQRAVQAKLEAVTAALTSKAKIAGPGLAATTPAGSKAKSAP
ncbi:peptidylprolyl isomerase [Nevskia sp.]|uniref:peptidylprolyl isomerase n=1 Tax=Nevskia sp. TaxID=1929292 RepID=UPI0025D392B0|nr:peptidylprolyl isomerase [Nevskia sp.]